MKGSQYTESYLDYCEVTPVTPGTYLSRRLRGKAKKYLMRYLDALERDLERRVQSGEVVRCASVGGARAYKRQA